MTAEATDGFLVRGWWVQRSLRAETTGVLIRKMGDTVCVTGLNSECCEGETLRNPSFFFKVDELKYCQTTETSLSMLLHSFSQLSARIVSGEKKILRCFLQIQ